MPETPETASAPRPPKGASGPHWSKDYVEHLRTIHFSLIALSLAAVVLATSPDPSDLKKAQEQVNAIGELVRVWNPDWIGQAAEQVLSKSENEQRQHGNATADFIEHFLLDPKDANAIAFVDSQGHATTFRVNFIGSNWVLEGSVRDYYSRYSRADRGEPASESERAPFTQIHSFTLPAPRTLEDFRTLWNALDQEQTVRVPLALSKDFYGYQLKPSGADFELKKMGTVEWVNIPPNSTIPELKLTLRPFSKNFRQSLPPNMKSEGYFSIGPYMRNDGLLVTRDELFLFQIQEGLRDHFLNQKPVGGLFEHSFPELNKVTKNFQSLEIDKFDAILEAEQNRTGESFEAFGVKFPAEATTRWGILVILGVQLYFWIHLHELARKLQPSDPGWEVAFIGMYPSWSSPVIYSVSASVLPVCAVLALGIRGLYVGKFDWVYWLLLIGGTLISMALAVTGGRCAPRRSVSG